LAAPIRLRQISDRIPAARWGDPKDFAGPVVFLASSASQYVCGELLVVDGVGVIPSFIYLLSLMLSSKIIGLDGQVGEATEKMKVFQTGRITES